ncbi:glycosyltransferase [Oleispirillum naphthae]|uniref:glycosyltransferase n=1 Tax=Oleispirillum naphthae TaxID=2838853 RepID=UPI0030824064
MSQSVSLSSESWRHRLTAALIGLVVPAGAFGAAPVLIVAAAALLAGLSVPDRARHARRLLLAALFHPLGLACVVMLLAWAPNLFVSPDRLESAGTWLRVAVVLGGGVYLWSILDRAPRLARIARDFLLFGIAAALALSLAALVLAPETIAALRRTGAGDGPWMRYKAFSTALVCVVPFLAWAGWAQPGARRIAACAGAVLYAVFAVATDSRDAFAGLAVAGLAALFLPAARSPRARLAIPVLLVLAAAAVAALALHPGGRNPENIGALGLPLWLVEYQRQHIWAFILERLPERPWIGIGLNAIAHIPGADHLIPGAGQAFVPSHPHNWILEILAETGGIGFAPAFLAVAGLIVRDALAVFRGGSLRHAARLALSCAFWGTACFNFSIWAPWWGVTFVFLFLILSARPAIPAEPAPRMLFAVTEDFAFLSHRLPMAGAAKAAGFTVGVVCAVKDKRAQIEALGYAVHPWPVNRASTNPLREYLALNGLRRCYEETTPALVHHVALKPVVYGAIAAQLAGIPVAVNAMIGLGFLFISEGRKAGLLRRVVLAALRLALDRPGSRLLVQNPDDAAIFAKAGVIAPERIVLIPGSGVDAERFRPLPEPPGETIVVSVVSRMLWDKGIGETVEAARILRERGLPVRLRLVGDVDPANPQSIHPATLCLWNADGLIEWKGPRKDIGQVWAESHIALLPSYREGMPKALLEAAACGRPLIAADAPGCRSLVADGENGLLVPVKDSAAIAEAIARLAADPALRRRMGAEARRRIEETYADPIVAAQVEALYRSLAAAETGA